MKLMSLAVIIVSFLRTTNGMFSGIKVSLYIVLFVILTPVMLWYPEGNIIILNPTPLTNSTG